MSDLTKAEWRDLYDACFLVMSTISEKLDGTRGFFFTPKEKQDLRAEYVRFVILSGKVLTQHLVPSKRNEIKVDRSTHLDNPA
jgi:hypothetical protein